MDDFADAFRAAKEQFQTAGPDLDAPPTPPPYDDAPEHWSAEIEVDTPQPVDPTTLWVSQDAWLEAEIPQRPWVAPGYFLRDSCSVLSGPGGGGKSSIVVAWTIALALGIEAGEFRPVGPVVAVNYNVEDDYDEQLRRYSAGLRAIRKTPKDLEGRVIRCGPSTIGTLFERDPVIGRVFPTPAMDALEALCKESGASVLICDPLAELHNAEENDNTAMRAVIAAFRGMARRLHIAILILHHDRKGTPVPGDMDRMRGASALAGAVRVALTLTPMSEEEAEKFGVKPVHRRRHFRVDGAKANYAIAQDAEWWKLEGYELGNGEEIAACRPWTPPSAFSDMSMGYCVAILERLALGTTDGRPWGAHVNAKAEWAGSLLTDDGKTDTQAKAVLFAWKQEGVLKEIMGESSRRGHERAAYEVNLAKLSEMRRQVAPNMSGQI